MEHLRKSRPTSTRSETVSIRLEPRVRYLVEIAARDQQRTLSSFIETVIRKALTVGFNEEPMYGTAFANPLTPKPMWGEGLWDEDQADRLFLLATTRHDLLTLAEQRLWKLLSEGILFGGKTLNIQNFRASFHDALVDKAHLESEAE